MRLSRSEARRVYWSTKTQEERSGVARHAALIRHSQMSQEEKKVLINNLQEARMKAKKTVSKVCKKCGKKNCNC